MLTQYDKILVTGGLGFVGTSLTEALLSLGKEVVILDKATTADNKPASLSATLIQADVCDPIQTRQVIKDVGADVIFHMAGNANGSISVTDTRFDFETNALGTFNVLEAASHTQIKKFIYISSASVYGEPQMCPINEEHPIKPFIPYGVSKLTGELYCLAFFRTFGLPVAVARAFCIYGPGERASSLAEVSRYIRWHLNQKPIQIVGDMKLKTRDFISVQDLIQDLLLLADRASDGEIFNLGSGEEVSMLELTEIIGTVTGRKPIIDEVSHITNDSYRLVADISKLRTLGCKPRTPLIEGIKQLVTKLGKVPALPVGETIFES